MFEINVIIGTLKASIKSNNKYINPVKGNLWEINANNHYCYFNSKNFINSVYELKYIYSISTSLI